MDEQRGTDDSVPTPIAWEPPESDEQLRAEERAVRVAANRDAAIRGAGLAGALGGNVPIGSGGVIGQGGALGIEETEREERLNEPPAIDEASETGGERR
jgi:hypothetical protein